MHAKEKVRSIMQDAVDSLSNGYKGSSLTDVFLIIDKESGELLVYDDEGNCISKGIVEEWEDITDEEEIDYPEALRAVVEEMDDEGLFSSLNVYTPFSISIAGEDFVIQEELLTIEDGLTVRMDDDFLKRMDKEFDDFLYNLLKE